jgi:hypothetical protein
VKAQKLLVFHHKNQWLLSFAHTNQTREGTQEFRDALTSEHPVASTDPLTLSIKLSMAGNAAERCR